MRVASFENRFLSRRDEDNGTKIEKDAYGTSAKKI